VYSSPQPEFDAFSEVAFTSTPSSTTTLRVESSSAAISGQTLHWVSSIYKTTFSQPFTFAAPLDSVTILSKSLSISSYDCQLMSYLSTCRDDVTFDAYTMSKVSDGSPRVDGTDGNMVYTLQLVVSEGPLVTDPLASSIPAWISVDSTTRQVTVDRSAIASGSSASWVDPTGTPIKFVIVGTWTDNDPSLNNVIKSEIFSVTVHGDTTFVYASVSDVLTCETCAAISV